MIISIVYKTGFTKAYAIDSYDEILEMLKHKRGRKPQGFTNYSKDGTYEFYVDFKELTK